MAYIILGELSFMLGSCFLTYRLFDLGHFLSICLPQFPDL